MRLLRIAYGALGGVVLAASSAFAADIAAIPPPPVWGLYFGGGVCYDWANFDIEKTKYGKLIWQQDWYQLGDPETFDVPAKAPCLTLTFGYDWQIDPHWLVGIMASYDWQDKHGDKTKDPHRDKDKSFNSQPLTLAEGSLGDIATVAVRAGMLPKPDLLVYALFGWSWSNASFALLPPFGPGASGNVSGPTVGAGVEALFHRNWSGRVEYRFTDFGSLSDSVSGCVWFLCGREDGAAHITDQSIRLVLVYRP